MLQSVSVECVSDRKDWSSSTLAERLKWAFDHADAVTQNEFAQKAGVASGSMSKLMKSDDVDARRKAHSLTAIARAWGFSAGWLMSGEGDPLSGAPPMPVATRTVELDARYPNLEAAIAYHPKDKWKPATIAAARSWTFKSNTDPEPPEWAALMDEIENRLLGAERRFLEPDEPPPAATPEGLDELDRQMAEEAKERRRNRRKKG